jgi:CDP-diacylglycerol--serine O-phosphatidyltransferase
MSTPNQPEGDKPAHEVLKIYFLPNLMTAGNLFCGFLALTKIVEADQAAANFDATIRLSMFLILLACIFDLLDGRVARMGGYESPFGREFDSLADLISFGAAPAFLVHRIVLRDLFIGMPEVGWFIASMYLICGALRLARFNCLAAMSGSGGGKEFLGFPIPAAAGVVVSLTLLCMWWDNHFLTRGSLRYVLPVILMFLSIMMVSNVRYPTFKTLDLRATRTFTKTVLGILFIGILFILQEKVLYLVLPFVFTGYLLYGFVRPRISRKIVQELEDEDEEPHQG